MRKNAFFPTLVLSPKRYLYNNGKIIYKTSISATNQKRLSPCLQNDKSEKSEKKAMLPLSVTRKSIIDQKHIPIGIYVNKILDTRFFIKEEGEVQDVNEK